ncbi:hypothetical protein FJZ31_41565, partial [Candidatus Poribacteria bacterium]|nr:hypothetical protein [Candidatus Poribacteria bacterium]
MKTKKVLTTALIFTALISTVIVIKNLCLEAKAQTACYEEVSFSDNFESGSLANWSSPIEGWNIVDESGNKVVERTGGAPTLLINKVVNAPSMFSLSTQLRILDDWSATGLVFNYQNQDNYYFAYISWT